MGGIKEDAPHDRSRSQHVKSSSATSKKVIKYFENCNMVVLQSTGEWMEIGLHANFIGIDDRMNACPRVTYTADTI